MKEEIKRKVDAFFRLYKQQKYRKGEILIRAGESPSGIFYLVEGHVKSYAISSKGDELIVNIFKPPAFFPMSYAVNKSKNDYFYETAEAVICYKAPPDDVLKFVKENSDVMLDLLARIYQGTDGLLSRMTYLMAGRAYARLVTELIIHAKRFGLRKGKNIEIKITEKDLASQTGLTRETVSREMKVLKDKGLVTFDSVIVLKDMSKLEDELFQL